MENTNVPWSGIRFQTQENGGRKGEKQWVCASFVLVNTPEWRSNKTNEGEGDKQTKERGEKGKKRTKKERN